MTPLKSKSIIPGILSAYRRLFKSLITVILFITGTAVASLAVALPLWYFAASHTRGFSIFALILLIGLIVVAAIGRGGFSGKFSPGRFLYKTARILAGIAFLFALYGIVLLFSRQLTFWAVAACAAFAFVFGMYLYGFFSWKRT